ncbi:ankyrin repeat-containing domain protein [Mycena olivaceomarginata]|nr:ankyrin repeat-containing domain protein [Mycena olivaceomarginata]
MGETARLLLENGADVNATGGEYNNPLYRNGHVETVRPLFDHGAEVNAAAREYGSTVLQAASYNGHLEVVRLLPERGANVNAAYNGRSSCLT